MTPLRALYQSLKPMEKTEKPYEVYVYWPGQGRGSSMYFYTFPDAWKWASFLLSPDMGYGRENNEVVIKSSRHYRVESRSLCS